jgi:hypothetical protein
LCKTPNETVVKYALQGMDTPIGVTGYSFTNDYQLTNAVPAELQSELPTIEALEQELERETEAVMKPLDKKLNRLKERIVQTVKEKVQKERDSNDVRYLFSELLPKLQQEIEKVLAPFLTEFTKVEIGRRINSTSSRYLLEPDLEALMAKENISILGLSLRMEGFKNAGVHTFGVWKELFIDLHQYKYGIGPEQHKPLIEKLYHQKWNEEEIRELVERWCEEVVDDITDRIERLNS